MQGMKSARAAAFAALLLALLAGISSAAVPCSSDAACKSLGNYGCFYGQCAKLCPKGNADCTSLQQCVDNHCADIPRTCAVSGEWAGIQGQAGSISWISLAFGAILVIMLFLSIAYMAGVLFWRVDWIVWAKDEFYQAIISAVMVLVVSWIALAACEASFMVAKGDPFKVADIYLNNLAWEKTLHVATGVFMTGIYASITSAFFLPMGSPPSGSRPLSGLSAVSGIMNFLFMIVATLFSSLLMQGIMLKIIQALMFKVVLPIGVFFRVFPFLRTAGATFIALALGFYIVFPLMYVMDKAIMEDITGNTIRFENTGNIGLGGYAKLFAWDGIIRQLFVMDHVQDVANLIPQALFLPTFNIVVTYAFIKSAAKIFAQNFPSPFG